MGFHVNFYSISKRTNSTLLPTDPIESEEVVLKDGCSLLDPVLILQHAGAPYWSHFAMEGRYYKITDIRSVRNNIWEVSGTVDILASWKSEILATNAFVAYDTTPNTEISDRRLSVKTTTTRSEAAGNAFDMIGKGMAVVVNTVGETACATYVMTIAQAAGLLDTLGNWKDNLIPEVDPDDPPADWLEKIADSITQGFRQIISSGSAADCIKSAFIIPVPAGSISGTSETVMLGSFNTGVSATRRTSRGIQDAAYVAIPWQAADWRRNAPYHEIYLYIPFVGVVNFPASALIGASGLYVNVAFDETAGDALVTVAANAVSGGVANHVIGQYSTNIAANFAIGASNITPRQLATSIAAAAGVVGASLMTGGAAAVAAGTAGIAGEFNSVTPIPSSVGGAGGGAVLALFGYAPRCMTIFHDTVVAPDSVSAVIGTPANATKSLAGLSGYVETRNASVSGAMTERERLEINRYLDGGIYIE